MIWAERLAALGPGTRVVVRYRISTGFTDALGVLTRIDGSTCDVQTRKGPVTIALAEVVAAKQVPPPPGRRNPVPR